MLMQASFIMYHSDRLAGRLDRARMQVGSHFSSQYADSLR